jgi:glycosyltransferase involved in cell wall biosynthesis
MTLHVIPIESMAERYSGQWLRWFYQYFNSNMDIDVYLSRYDPYHFLETGKFSEITNGQFLDVAGTNIYKARQLQKLCEDLRDGVIKDGDILLFLDGWFPGLEMLAYIRDGLGLKVKFVGMLHAGTYDPHDFLTQRGMGVWAQHMETGWFEIYDKIIVATEYHKSLILKSRQVDPNKIKVVFFPMMVDWVAPIVVEKDPIVVFPHRLAPEKQPDRFKLLAQQLYPESLSFVMTKEVVQTKQDYWELLARCKFAVSFAKQETWGIAMIESVLSGCIPIVPDRCSYTEMYPAIFRYSGSSNAHVEVEQVQNKIVGFLNPANTAEVFSELCKLQLVFKTIGRVSIPRIVGECFS